MSAFTSRDIRVIHARDFLSAKPDGEIDVRESLRLLREVVDALEHTAAFDVLVDTRRAISNLTAAQLWYLADAAAQHPRLHTCRISILCPEERFDHASFYALCAERKGIDMRAFVSYEDAMTWLWQ